MFVVSVISIIFCVLGLIMSAIETHVELFENFDRAMAYVRFGQCVMWSFCGITILEIM